SQLKLLGGTALFCALALGSAGSSGWFGRLAEAHEPVGSAPNDDPQADLTRSVDKLESGLEEASRWNAGMRKELREIRSRLKAVGEARERAARLSREALAQLAGALQPNPARAVAQLADVLRRHPARRAAVGEHRLQLYMMDLAEGGTTLLADEPDPGLD